MTHTTMTVYTDDVFTDLELRTLVGFLGGYSGLTRDAYAFDRAIIEHPPRRTVDLQA